MQFDLMALPIDSNVEAQSDRFWVDTVARTMTAGSGSAARTMVLPRGSFAATDIEGFGLDISAKELRIRLPGGQEVVAELPAPTTGERDCRLVVYLDQNHWSQLTKLRVGHPRADEREREAAQELQSLVESKAIVIPASSGNYTETVPLWGQQRVDHAHTVLDLSRGWQMESPLRIRVAELRAALSDDPAASRRVFGPAADALFTFPTPRTDAMGLSSAFAQVASHIPRVLALYETLVEPEAITEGAERAKELATRWASAHAELATRLRQNQASPKEIWRAVYANLLLDLQDDLAAAAQAVDLSINEAITRLCAENDPLGHAPFLSRMRAWLFARVRNPTQRWSSNDLIDGMYLCCSAGYADITVGETNAINYLGQARKLPPGARLTHTLRDAVAALHAKL